MTEETVTVGDTEVEIRETEDGFEAVEAESSPEPGFYVRAVSKSGNYGFEIPLDEADAFVIEYDATGLVDPHRAAWDSSANVDNRLRDEGGAKTLADEEGFDGHAVVSDVEIVERGE